MNLITRRAGSSVAALAAALLAAASLTACGGDDGDTDAGDPPGASPSASSSVAAENSESPAAGATYLPVPGGVTLTEPGSELGLKESALVAWEPRQDLVGVLDITVNRVEKTSFAKSFEGWQLDKDTRKTTPYFVRATVLNAGATDLGGRAVPLYALDTTDKLVQASSFETRYKPCPGNGSFPKKFASGDAHDVCLVYLVPQGGELASVTFRPVQDFLPITWTGQVKDLTAPKDKKNKKNKNKKKNKSG